MPRKIYTNREVSFLQPSNIYTRERLLPEESLDYLADRYDISEEIQRLETHIHNFKTMLQKQHVGKKMGFLLQEMGREVNTIGSKLPDNDISFEVVKIKDSLEKIREQVQNVE